MIEAKAFCYGDDINTDLLYPGRYTYKLLNEEEMASHALEDLDPAFAGLPEGEYVIVAGRNFGCGSAREQAVKALKAKGVRAVIARSISRIYYRNCINEGILPIINAEIPDAAQNGDGIRIDPERSVVLLRETEYPFPPFPEYVRQIIQAGGIIASVKEMFHQKDQSQKEEEA